VDGILPLAWLQPPDEHEDFWQAVQRTNIELEPDGLYLTHLFRELDVILQPDWINRRLRLVVGLQKLAVFRPATIDLILTKMARADEDDLQDIQFLLQQESITREQLTTAFCPRPCPGRARDSGIIQSRATQSACPGSLVTGAFVHADFPRKCEYPFPQNGGNPESPRPCIYRFGRHSEASGILPSPFQ
jgi:hypothetical protein